VLSEGLPWSWESFPDYLDFLSSRQFDTDIGAQLPHAALRVFVMGERGANREEASAEDIAAMKQLAKEAVMAGALGFSTSRTLNHRTSDGQPTPTLTASETELVGIAEGLKEANRGVLQFVSDFNDPQKEAAMLRRIVEASGRPLSVSLAQADVAPEGWRALLGAIETAMNEGLPMRAQVAPRPVGVLLGLELTMNPFSAHPSYAAICQTAAGRTCHRPARPGLPGKAAVGGTGIGQSVPESHAAQLRQDIPAARSGELRARPRKHAGIHGQGTRDQPGGNGARPDAGARRARRALLAFPQLLSRIARADPRHEWKAAPPCPASPMAAPMSA
jgi:hypothetical protein